MFTDDMSDVCNNSIDTGIALTDCLCSPPNTRYNYALADWDALLLDLWVLIGIIVLMKI